MRWHRAVMAAAMVAFANACTDASAPVNPVDPEATATLGGRDGRGDFHRYVAIGTSISMGWASNGVYAGGQQVSWTAQLARMGHRRMSLPLIEDPGCTSPLVAPLSLARRRSGESVAGSTVCAPNAAGVELPAANVAIAGALAHEAISLTPEGAGPAKPFYARVLPAGATQLSAALAQHPKIVSVELGGNEVLQASRGLIAPGVTVVPLHIYEGAMARLFDALEPAAKKVVVFGLPSNAANLPSLRHASEIWAARGAFAALHVAVHANCETSANWVNVSTLGLARIYEGQQRKAAGFPMASLSCADVPGALDDIVTPADLATLDAMLARINAFLQTQAAARGFAYASLGALYDRPDLKAFAYNPITQLTSHTPYGPLVSLDAIHPSALGHAILADAAAEALNARYDMRMRTRGAGVLVALAR